MPYTVYLFLARKPGMSVADFKHHYENIHMPLVHSILGDAAPIRHTRWYLKRAPFPADPSSTTTADPSTTAATADAPLEPPPLTFVGSVDYDCITSMEFADEEHFARFADVSQNGPRRAEMLKDNEAFADLTSAKMVAVEEGMVLVTRE